MWCNTHHNTHCSMRCNTHYNTQCNTHRNMHVVGQRNGNCSTCTSYLIWLYVVHTLQHTLMKPEARCTTVCPVYDAVLKISIFLNCHLPGPIIQNSVWTFKTIGGNRWHIMTQRHFGQFDGYCRFRNARVPAETKSGMTQLRQQSSCNVLHFYCTARFFVPGSWMGSWLCLCNMWFFNNDPETNLTIFVNMYIVYRYIRWHIYTQDCLGTIFNESLHTT